MIVNENIEKESPTLIILKYLLHLSPILVLCCLLVILPSIKDYFLIKKPKACSFLE